MSVRLTDYSGGTVTDSHRVPSANPHQFRGIMEKNLAGVNGFRADVIPVGLSNEDAYAAVFDGCRRFLIERWQ
jgi:hypothetical protein